MNQVDDQIENEKKNIIIVLVGWLKQAKTMKKRS